MNNLKKIRKEKGKTQQRVAIDLNISREALSYYENGVRDINTSMLKIFADYYKVTIDYILDYSKKSDNEKTNN